MQNKKEKNDLYENYYYYYYHLATTLTLQLPRTVYCLMRKKNLTIKPHIGPENLDKKI